MWFLFDQDKQNTIEFPTQQTTDLFHRPLPDSFPCGLC